MKVKANSKINIGLNIVEKRSDGFHNIESVFYPISWSDKITIEKADHFSFSSSGIEIPGEPNENLCVKAYELMKADYDLDPVSIHLEKIVPIGAGLGGGSADASAVLKALNRLFKLKCSNDELIAYAQQLGSDCAFFIENEVKYCYGKGDQFEEVDLDLSNFKIVLVNPNIHISTGKAYSNVKVEEAIFDLKMIDDFTFDEWKDLVSNAFEMSVEEEFPQIPSIKQSLYDLGALYAAMTGSGSTVFGIFDKDQELDLSNFDQYQTFIHE